MIWVLKFAIMRLGKFLRSLSIIETIILVVFIVLSNCSSYFFTSGFSIIEQQLLRISPFQVIRTPTKDA